jgi:hypothetical protein
MVNYSESIIYKICCRNTDIKEIYIGSTTNFRLRKCQHKTICHNNKNKKYNLRVYQFIRDNGGWENFDMVQVEQYNATDKRDLHSRERHWFEQLNANLNSQIPSRTQKEYNKEYYKDNKDKISSYKKQYYHQKKEIKTCVCGGTYEYGHTSTRNRHYRTQKHTEYVKKIHEHLSELMSQS